MLMENCRSAKQIIGLPCFIAIILGCSAVADPPGNTPTRDVLIFTDGEKLLGVVQRADSSSVVFKSDMAGVVTIEWKKVQELRTAQNVVVVPKGVKLIWRKSYPDVNSG